VLAAGLIWAIIGVRYHGAGQHAALDLAIREYLVEFAQLFLFLLSAMTYVNSLSERRVFETLRYKLVSKGLSALSLFWITGIISFFLSALIDNLTTALVMSGVVLAVGKGNPRFIAVNFVNIVVAANAGGAFSPFGDITTLMVWQSGQLHVTEILTLLLPSMVNYLVPAVFMSLAVKGVTLQSESESVKMRPGAKWVMALLGFTITLSVSFHHFIGLPPFLGMMTGLACLQIYGYFLRRKEQAYLRNNSGHMAGDVMPYDSFREVARVQWDTLLFFYGVVMCVGGLGYIGYLAYASEIMYADWGATNANIGVGILSAIVDNIPVMFAVLTMNPDMPLGQWLLVTLTAGVGGSLLSIGSAAGVALMGQAHGKYTFFSHLRWTPVIAIGYAASVAVHMWINSNLF
jgi:Na+/H+ antiporter NhaD/arsenite permease-like protein